MIEFRANLGCQHIKKRRCCVVVNEVFCLEVLVKGRCDINRDVREGAGGSFGYKQEFTRFIHEQFLPMQTSESEREQGNMCRLRGEVLKGIEVARHMAITRSDCC